MRTNYICVSVNVAVLLLLFSCQWTWSGAFVPMAVSQASRVSTRFMTAENHASDGDPKDIVARRIIVKGDVQGGYYRVCVRNEASRFRRLVGTMSPPDDTDEAEIYVEGSRKMVDGFVRWCEKSDVGLSQVMKVTGVFDEDPTGLYDEFYVKVKDD